MGQCGRRTILGRVAKKRKTLPKNVEALIEAKDIPGLKAMFDTCALDAIVGRWNKETVLHMIGVPDELVRWLVEQGLDIEVRDQRGQTPLHCHCWYWRNEKVPLFIELGADIMARDNSGATPLHDAASHGRIEVVNLLLGYGADVNAKEKSGMTPLLYALTRCRNAGITEMAVVAEILMAAGAAITPAMADQVKRIGEQFEFYRDVFNPEAIPETDAALSKLYSLFNVEPVARRVVHDGPSPIVTPKGPWHQQHQALWKLLVPGGGHAKTVQGEVIRVSGKLAYEIMDNGSINWCDDHRAMLAGLVKYFGMGTPLASASLEEASRLAHTLRGGNGDREPERLMELAVHWVQANPGPITLEPPSYTR